MKGVFGFEYSELEMKLCENMGLCGMDEAEQFRFIGELRMCCGGMVLSGELNVAHGRRDERRQV